MTFFNFLDSVNSYGVSSACEFFLKEHVNHTKCYAQSDNALAECQDIGIVMLSAHPCHEFVAAESASDPLVLVAYERDPDTRTADSDSPVCPAACNVFCNLNACIYIRIRVRAVRSASVKNGKALFFQVLYDFLS